MKINDYIVTKCISVGSGDLIAGRVKQFLDGGKLIICKNLLTGKDTSPRKASNLIGRSVVCTKEEALEVMDEFDEHGREAARVKAAEIAKRHARAFVPSLSTGTQKAGAAPWKLMTVLVSEIFIPDWQRPLGASAVRKIVANFRDELFDELRLNERSPKRGDNVEGCTLPKYSCMQGQHRLAALREMGVKRVQAKIAVPAKTPDEEALYHNDSYEGETSEKVWDSYRQRLKGKDPSYVELDKAIRAVGLTASNSKADGKISCLRRLINLQKKDASLLERTLRICTQAWGKDKYGVEGNMVGGVAHCLASYPEVGGTMDVRLINKLLKVAPTKILGDCRARGGHIKNEVAAHLVDEYNKGLRAGQLDRQRCFRETNVFPPPETATK